MNSIAPTSATKTSSRGCLIYLAVAISTFMIVFMTAAVITYLMPKKFISTAVIQVRPLSQIGQSITPQFFATEFEVIKSNLTLKPVVQKLDLINQWMMTEDQAIAILRDTLRVQNIRGTDLIEIKVMHTDRALARDIAKTVFESYKKRREDKERELVERSLKEMEEALADQADVVEEKLTQRDNILKRSNDVTNPTYLQAQREFETQKALLEKMRDKLAMERLDTKKISMIELHEAPVIGQLPSSPNVNLNLIMGATLGLLFGCGMALFVWFVFGRKIST